MNSQEEEEDGGHVSGGCSYAVSQDLFEIPPQFSQSRQLSTGKSVERGGTSGKCVNAFCIEMSKCTDGAQPQTNQDSGTNFPCISSYKKRQQYNKQKQSYYLLFILL